MSSDITLEGTIYRMFSTRAFATGIPTTLAGTPVVSAYENDSVTQITAGITLGVDHDGVTGMHLLTIAATAANGYESGKDYALVITTGTVDAVSVVGEVVGEFTIGRSAAAVDLANGTDGLGAIKALIDAVKAKTDAQPAGVQTAQTTTPDSGAGKPDLEAKGAHATAQIDTAPTPAAGTPTYDSLLAEAQALIAKRKQRQAQALLTKALQLNPQGWEALQESAMYLMDRGKMDQALKMARKAEAINSNAPYAQLVIGAILHERRKLPEAKKAYETFLQLCPGCRFANDIRAVLKSM